MLLVPSFTRQMLATQLKGWQIQWKNSITSGAITGQEGSYWLCQTVTSYTLFFFNIWALPSLWMQTYLWSLLLSQWQLGIPLFAGPLDCKNIPQLVTSFLMTVRAVTCYSVSIEYFIHLTEWYIIEWGYWARQHWFCVFTFIPGMCICKEKKWRTQENKFRFTCLLHDGLWIRK